MPKPVKNTRGDCPYCGSDKSLGKKERRPGQRVHRCGSCGQYSVVVAKTGVRYPVADPRDPDSPPNT